MSDYGARLNDADFDVNALLVVITDGMDNESGFGADRIAAELEKVGRAEKLESLVSILVGVGTGRYADVQQYLDKVVQEGKIGKYINIADADAKQLAKLADFISKSVSSQSQALGTGHASQILTF